MLQDINGKTLSNPLGKPHIESHWKDYEQYEKVKELFDLTNDELAKLIKIKKAEASPFIDSAVLISELLTELGKTYQFHRKFNEIFPHLTSGSVLGMQLYLLLIDDSAKWIFHKSKKADHLYSSSLYFISK